jgi:hypothetical protein
MGSFGSRGGLFLVAPIKRRVPSDAPPVRRACNSGPAHSTGEPNTGEQGSPCWRQYFETLYTEETVWEENAERRSDP